MVKTKLEQKVEQLIEEKSFCVKSEEREWYKQCMKEGFPFSLAVHRVCIGPMEQVVCYRSEYEAEKQKESLEDLDLVVPQGVTLSKQYGWLFTRVKNAINDRKQEWGDQDRSYSRNIMIPLFKYGNAASRLVVKALSLNTIKLRVQIDYLDDPGVSTKLYVNVPFSDINNISKIKEYIQREIEKEAGLDWDFYSIVNREVDMDADMVGFTLDVTKLSKVQLLKLAITDEEVAWHKSYRADREVISSEKLYRREEIRSEAATQLARYLVLYCLCQDIESIDKLLAAYEAEDLTEGFEYNSYEKWAFRQIHAYLLKDADMVRADWIKLFGSKDGTYKDYFVADSPRTKITRQMVADLMERLRKNTPLLSDDRLYHRVMEITGRI